MGILVTQALTVSDNGKPLANARVYFYENLTTTPKGVYSDPNLTVPASNPAISDINGQVFVYLEDTPYSIRITKENGEVIETRDYVYGLNVADGVTNGDPGLSVFETYHGNSRDTQPAPPRGDGTSDGWHRTILNGDNWKSVKSALDVNSGNWSDAVLISGPPGSDGTTIEFRFQESAAQPATPTVSDPAGWSLDTPDIPTPNTALWMIKAAKDSSGNLVGAWTTPVKIRGEDGEDGNYVDYRFQRNANQPATPSVALPAGWSDAPPPDNGEPLWMITASKNAAGDLLSTWSSPVQLNGDQGYSTRLIFIRQATQPSTPTGQDPAGWSNDDPNPGSTVQLWMSYNLVDVNGDIVTSWSVPVKFEGHHGVDGDTLTVTPSVTSEIALFYDGDNATSLAGKVSGGEFTVLKNGVDVTADATYSWSSSALPQVFNMYMNNSNNEFFTGPKGAYIGVQQSTDVTPKTFIRCTYEGITYQYPYQIQKVYQPTQPGAGGSMFNATVNRTNVSRFGNGSLTTESVTATPDGGDSPYTYSWAKVSGDTVTINTPTNAGTTFSATVNSSGDNKSGVYRCTVTDDNSDTAETADVNVAFFYFDDL